MNQDVVRELKDTVRTYLGPNQYHSFVGAGQEIPGVVQDEVAALRTDYALAKQAPPCRNEKRDEIQANTPSCNRCLAVRFD